MFLKWTVQVSHRQVSRLPHFQFISYSAAQSFSQCRWDQVRSVQKLLQAYKESISLDREPRTLYLSSQPTAAAPHTSCPPNLNFSFPEFTRICSPPGFWTGSLFCLAKSHPFVKSQLKYNLFREDFWMPKTDMVSSFPVFLDTLYPVSTVTPRLICSYFLYVHFHYWWYLQK